jgi:hypothetical protein
MVHVEKADPIVTFIGQNARIGRGTSRVEADSFGPDCGRAECQLALHPSQSFD